MAGIQVPETMISKGLALKMLMPPCGRHPPGRRGHGHLPQKGLKGIPQGNLRKTGIVSSVCPPMGWVKRSRMTPPLQPSDVWAAFHRTFRIEWLPGPIRALPATHSETRKSDGIRISAMRISS